LDLSGERTAPFTVLVTTPKGPQEGWKTERVAIRQTGNAIAATKITGDDFVPAGKLNLRATISGSSFTGEQLCAARGVPASLLWLQVKISLLDKDHFKVEGGCSGGAIWTRDKSQKLS
jgi:hypothetical protein